MDKTTYWYNGKRPWDISDYLRSASYYVPLGYARRIGLGIGILFYIYEMTNEE